MQTICRIITIMIRQIVCMICFLQCDLEENGDALISSRSHLTSCLTLAYHNAADFSHI